MATKKKQTKKTEVKAAPRQNALPLFYRKPVPLDKKHHAGHSLSDKLDFSFAAKVNAVPINLVEFPSIMQVYPIAFSAANPATPLAILGLKDGQNLFVDDDGQWLENTYIPAYVRRYPFIFAQDEESQRLTLCVDDAKGILAKNKKRPFFDKAGEPTTLVNSAIEFCKSYQVATTQTLKFSEALVKQKLLEDRHAEIKTQDGNVLSLSGFRQVNERKLSELGDKTVLLWHKTNWLRSVHAQLLSTSNWQNLFQMMEERNAKKPKKKGKSKTKAKATKKKK